MRFNKKGIVNDVGTGIVVLFSIGFVLILCYTFLSMFIDGFAATPFYSSTMANVADSFLGGLRIFDYLMIVIMAVMIIGIGIASYKLASAPVFFVTMLIMSFIMGLISFFFNYTFSQMVSDPVFLATTVYFTNTILICTNLHWIALAMMVIGSITAYGKRDKGQFQ